MTHANPYFRFSKLTEDVFCKILECFAADLTATDTARITSISVRSVNTIFIRIRRRLVECCEIQRRRSQETMVGVSEVITSREPPGGQNEDVTLLGLLEWGGKIYTEKVSHSMEATLRALLRGQLALQSVVGSRNWRGYDGLVDLESGRFFRVNASSRNSAPRYPEGLEAFWAFTEKRLRKFHGLPRKTLWLHVKECEFRYNQREQNLFLVLQAIMRERPL